MARWRKSKHTNPPSNRNKTGASRVDELERIKQLAGVNNVGPSMGENLSYTGTAKAEYERKHNIKRGSDEWFRLWFARPNQTGEDPMPKK